MTAPAKCPGCGTKLPPEATACPNCPLSFPENDNPADAVHPLKQAAWYPFLMPLLFFAGIGLGIWSLAAGFLRLAGENAVIEKSPALYGGAPAAAPSSSTVTPPAPPPALPAEEQGPGSITVVKAEAPPREPTVGEWRFRGTVYDLVTLQPLTDVKVFLIDTAQGRRNETRSSADGRFRTVVPSTPGRDYAVAVAKDGYSPAFLRGEDVRDMSAAERLKAARGLASALSPQPLPLPSAGAKPVVTDLYLAPRR